MQKRSEKERERIANRKKKFDALKEAPKHVFNDSSFYQEQEKIESSLHDAIDKGLQVAAEESSRNIEAGPSTSGSGSDSNDSNSKTANVAMKRKNTESAPNEKIKRSKFFDDLDDSSDESDEAEH